MDFIEFTGNEVLKHYGSRLQLIGFAPDSPVDRTIQAIKEGSYENLVKAIEIIKADYLTR